MIKASVLFLPHTLSLPERSNKNCYLQVNGVREEIVKTEVANEISGPNGPDECMKAGESFVDAHVSNQLRWMDPQLWIVEYGKRHTHRQEH